MQYQRPATQAYGGMPAAMPQASMAQAAGFASSPYYSGQQGAGAAFASSQQPNFAAQQGMRPAGYGQAAPVAAPYVQPVTSNVGTGTIGGQAARPAAPSQAQPFSMTAQPGLSGTQNFVTPGMVQGQAAMPAVRAVGGGREQALEQRIRELESVLSVKEQTIEELESQLASAKNQKGGRGQARSPGRSGNGFRKVQDSKPVNRYTGVDGDDPIDVRLAEYYNSTGSAIQFRRINRGFYRFGDSIVELDIINHKLMARTEDGWNRGKFGPVEKFMMHYENIEREKAGVLPDFARNNF